MDIKCRKTSCKFNDGETCFAKSVDISGNVECHTFCAEENKGADFSKRMFEAGEENFSNSRHIKEVNLFCQAGQCLFNKSGTCNANGITVLDEGKGCTACGTFIKE